MKELTLTNTCHLSKGASEENINLLISLLPELLRETVEFLTKDDLNESFFEPFNHGVTVKKIKMDESEGLITYLRLGFYTKHPEKGNDMILFAYTLCMSETEGFRHYFVLTNVGQEFYLLKDRHLSKYDFLALEVGVSAQILPVIQHWWTKKAEEVWDIPIKELVSSNKFPSNLSKYFDQAGIQYLREVQRHPTPKPRMFRNVGKVTCEEVISHVHNLGLKFKDE